MKESRVGQSDRTFSKFWLRRLSKASLLVNLFILLTYASARFLPGNYRFTIGDSVTDLAATISVLSAVWALGLCVWTPKKQRAYLACATYASLIITIAALIATSGGIYSPFTSLWLMVTIFAAVFGLWLTGGIILLVMAHIAMIHLETPLTLEQIAISTALGIMPSVLSIVLWRYQPQKKLDDRFTELENRLTSAEGKSDVVINTIDDGVMAISNDGIIELINPAAQQMIGWDKGDALGLSWQSVLKLVLKDGSDIPEGKHPVAQALSSNQPTHSDNLFLKTFSDKRLPITIVSSPIGPQKEGVIIVFRDISKERAEEREQAEFISTASHEMRTPVASIEGYLGLALNPATAQIDDKARDFITKAHASAQHLGRLFQDLLDISKAEDGRLKDEPKLFNVTDFVADIFEGLAHKAAEKNLIYSFRPHALAKDSADQHLQPIYYAFVDPDHFREITANLIENAIKYTKEGEVVVDVTGDSSKVVVSVMDSGLGIPAEDVPHLFQKFYRVDNSATREIGGTGLGLYLSRRLAESMSGDLRVESEYGKGSTFFLEIPRISKEEAAHKEASLQPASVQYHQPQQQAPVVPDTTPVEPPANPPVQPPAEQPQQPTEPAQSAKPLVQPNQSATPQQTPAPTSPEHATLADIEHHLETSRRAISIPRRTNNS